MRIFLAGIALALVLQGSIASAQTLNIKTKNISLAQFFKQLRKQTGYNVAWNEDEINADQILEVKLRNLPLKDALDQVLPPLSLNYSFNGKTIVIKRGERKPNKSQSQIVKPEGVEIRPIILKEVEIVRTGYQEISKQRVTGSFVLVDTFQFERRVGPDVISRLEGITSGLLFNKNTLSSNSGNLDLSIRGRSTIFANDQPLIILDNFPFRGDFNTINPNDIANITVLKDAAAAAIWGVRAGNGVIVITTNRGKFGQPLKVSLNTNYSISGKPDLYYNPNYLSSSDYIGLEAFLFENGKYDDVLADPASMQIISPVVKLLNRRRESGISIESDLATLGENDIRKEFLQYFYRREQRQQHALSLSGGTEKSNHYFSVGYDQTLSSLKENKDNRTTLNSQHTLRPLKNMELSLGLNYVRSLYRSDNTATVASGRLAPYYQFLDAQGNPAVLENSYSSAFNEAALDKGFLDWNYRPLDELGRSPNDLIGNDLRMNAGVKYNFITGLNAELKYQYQRIQQENQRFSGIETFETRNLINRYSSLTNGEVSGYNIPLGGVFNGRKESMVSSNLRGQLNYQKNWQNHGISALLGYEISEFETGRAEYTYYGYDQKTGSSIPVDTLTQFDLNPSGKGAIKAGSNLFGVLERIRSVYANIAYSYLGKYIISGSARIDGSNYFGVKTRQKNVPLWSTGALWNLDREDFYSIDWLPVLKLRASYGFNGNLERSNTGITTFKYNFLTAPYTNLPFAGIVNIGNPELRWEKIGIANFGLEFGLRDQLLAGKIEYYRKYGRDILGDQEFPSNSGIRTLRGNYSKINGQGIDVSLSVQPLKGRLRWASSFLLSAANDRVTLYNVAPTDSKYYLGPYNSIPVLEKPVFGVYSYQWAGLDSSNGDPIGFLNGKMSKDYASIFNTTSFADLKYNGPARPTIYGGLANTFAYQKFTLSFNISYKLGYYFRKSTVNYYQMYNSSFGGNLNTDFERRWRKTGDEFYTTVPSMADYSEDSYRDLFYANSGATVAKGDHIRLQDVNLSFDLDRSNWKHIPVKHVQLYAYANNLGILWRANDFGIDPDVIISPSGKLDAPVPRSFSLGLKANF